MIKTYRHKGLEKFAKTNSKKGIQPAYADRILLQLTALEAATKVSDVDVPGWVLHPMKHEGPDIWSIRVNGNYRILFRFVDGNAYDLDLIDPH